MTVTLQNFQAREDLNGRTAVVKQWDEMMELFILQVDGEPEPLSIDEDNILAQEEEAGESVLPPRSVARWGEKEEGKGKKGEGKGEGKGKSWEVLVSKCSHLSDDVPEAIWESKGACWDFASGTCRRSYCRWEHWTTCG